MAGTALLGRLTWRLGNIVEVVPETPRLKTIALHVPGWAGHRAGQHVDVRLTAEDGYQAERSYSIASPPDGTRLELTVERLDDGEVSPYLTDVLQAATRSSSAVPSAATSSGSRRRAAPSCSSPAGPESCR
jgi:ferredoxin-NADP reductase